MGYEPPGERTKGGFKREQGTAEVIRDHLLENGPDYVQSTWRAFRDWCLERGYTPARYDSFRSNHINMLKKLDLIQFVREEESNFGVPRKYYRVNPSQIDHPGWRNPRKALEDIA